jgi:hypothetical protein
MNAPDFNLNEAIDHHLDGTLSPEDFTRLQETLLTDPAARSLLRQRSQMDATLRDWTLSRQSTPLTAWQPSPKPPTPSSWFSRPIQLTLATAAAITLAFLLWPKETSTPEATSSGVAMLSQTLDAEFAHSPLRSGDTITPRTIQLTKGLTQIEFFSGATALLEGAAELEIISSWEARCLSGRIRVHVPPAAKGFLLHAPGMKLEDLGTEFALNVKDNSSAVYVFEGEVIAHTNRTSSSLKQGMTLGNTTTDFLPITELHDLLTQRQQRRFDAWQDWSQQARTDPRLIAYYTFKHSTDDRWDRLVNNFTEPRNPKHSGGAVGARWTEGRWPGKEALEFKRPGDRVRMSLEGTHSALTLSCWVKVDSVDKKYNSLLLTDGYDNGEPHWQIYQDGSLMFSIMYRPGDVPKSAKYNQIYYSKPVFTADSLGRWHHLAVTYDSTSGEVVQYFDAQEVGREISPLHQPARPITFGPCEIGNWGLPTQNHDSPIRNLNGAIDEFAIYQAVLSPTEILQQFEAGKPE